MFSTLLPNQIPCGAAAISSLRWKSCVTIAQLLLLHIALASVTNWCPQQLYVSHYTLLCLQIDHLCLCCMQQTSPKPVYSGTQSTAAIFCFNQHARHCLYTAFPGRSSSTRMAAGLLWLVQKVPIANNHHRGWTLARQSKLVCWVKLCERDIGLSTW